MTGGWSSNKKGGQIGNTMVGKDGQDCTRTCMEFGFSLSEMWSFSGFSSKGGLYTLRGTLKLCWGWNEGGQCWSKKTDEKTITTRQVRDDDDVDQICAVPTMIVNYKCILKLEPIEFADKLNGKCVRKKKKVKNTPRIWTKLLVHINCW